ncbi:MAG: hypothetical protein RR623_10070 [Bacilli bacterium]
MSFVILAIVIIFTFVAINKYLSNDDKEFVIDNIEWVESINDLANCQIVRDEVNDIHLKVLTRCDSHGNIICLDLLTLNNHAYECVSINKKFNRKRFIKVQ